MTDHDATDATPRLPQGIPADVSALAALPPGGVWLQELGLVLDELSSTRVTAHLDLGPQHHTPWGVVHGGVYTTVIETVASAGAAAAVITQGQFAVGVNNTTDFLRAMQAGRVEVLAEPIQQGRVQQLWQVALTRQADGKLIAQGRVRLQNVPLASLSGAPGER